MFLKILNSIELSTLYHPRSVIQCVFGFMKRVYQSETESITVLKIKPNVCVVVSIPFFPTAY